MSLPVMGCALFHSDNAYFVPNLHVTGRVCKTNKVSQTAFRGLGGPQGMMFTEEIVARVAQHLGLPAEGVRERNFYRGTGETAITHYGQEITDNRLERVCYEVLDKAEFTARKADVAGFNAAQPHRNCGLAVTPVKFGISFTPMNQAGVLILICQDGSVQLNHGGTEMGRGLYAKMLQVAATTLGVPLSQFWAMPTATDKIPNTSPTAASSGSDLNGQAVRAACETLQGRLVGVAAALLELPSSETLEFADGEVFSPARPDRRLRFTDVVRQAYMQQITLFATGFYRTPNLHFDPHSGKGRPFHYFAYGAAVSEVEVDGFTGQFSLRRVNIVEDAGTSLNPLVDRGQIEGGFMQSLGWLTVEEALWDEAGRFVTNAPSVYKIPTIADVPGAFHVTLLPRAAQDGVIYGSKAVGEPPFTLALSVREAVRNAVAASATATLQYIELAPPATPAAILRAVDAVRVPTPEPVSGD